MEGEATSLGHGGRPRCGADHLLGIREVVLATEAFSLVRFSVVRGQLELQVKD